MEGPLQGEVLKGWCSKLWPAHPTVGPRASLGGQRPAGRSGLCRSETLRRWGYHFPGRPLPVCTGAPVLCIFQKRCLSQGTQRNSGNPMPGSGGTR